jgi:hypothetical protein
VVFHPAGHRYEVNSEPVPSVTQILKVLDKPGLSWWEMTVGIEAVCELAHGGMEVPFADPGVVIELLKQRKLTVNHTLRKAGARGASIHKALERYANGERKLSLSDFPREDRGYVFALASGLLALRPVEFVGCEVVVGSAVYGYAGTYDLLIVDADGRRVRVDVKTSKRVYPEQHHAQLAAYEKAAVECGELPSDLQEVLRLAADGEYELSESVASFDDFISIKAAHDAVQRIKDAAAADDRGEGR